MSQKKNIVITGCSRGLGRALVNEFIAAGHYVQGCARSADAIDELIREQGVKGNFSKVDVSDEQAVSAWCQSILNATGAPDIVINNAAIINEPAVLWDIPSRKVQNLVNINIMGVHHVIAHMVPAMVAEQSGVVINLSSGWGRSVSAEVASYCASKWAIEGLSKALAEELPDAMACIPLSPGIIDTDMLRQAWGHDASGYRSAAVWATKAAPYILGLGAEHSGQSLTTPE